MGIPGIHHITTLASDPQANVDYYVGFLGLRLVKQTVNFDSPDVYHLYYGDELGRPGTILTFFPFPHATRGKRGAGETSAVAFSVPSGSLEFWVERLSRNGTAFSGPEKRFGEDFISFEDPDGMRIELFPDAGADRVRAWAGSAAGPRYAIRRFHGVTFTHRELEQPGAFLTGVLGFAQGPSEGNRHRFTVGSGEAQARIDILADPHAPALRQSAGSVHHIAWRVKDEEEQLAWRKDLSSAGVSPTPVLDRSYFHSIYFREPGGVLFELATDPPGFSIDEAPDALGTLLKLPPWLEPQRQLIERHLPPLSVPASVKAEA
ncbi:MAG: ring-cleaving dioxygenase [Spirochaetia bacterium]|jgi:glyoxalase family protein